MERAAPLLGCDSGALTIGRRTDAVPWEVPGGHLSARDDLTLRVRRARLATNKRSNLAADPYGGGNVPLSGAFARIVPGGTRLSVLLSASSDSQTRPPPGADFQAGARASRYSGGSITGARFCDVDGRGGVQRTCSS